MTQPTIKSPVNMIAASAQSSELGSHKSLMVGRWRRNSPAIVGIIVTLVILARQPVLICIRRLTSRRRSAAERAARLLSLPALRSAVLGHTRHYIARMFGPPPAATAGACIVWYYPLHTSQRVAMAILFQDETATSVEFIQSPLA